MALSNLTKVQTVGIGSNIEVVGVVTTGQFKSGTSNLHSTGVELTNLNVSGIATIGGNISIGGTLTYQDVTNVDSIGIITARAGVNVSGGQLDVGSNIKIGNAGVITATSFSGSGANLTSLPAQATIANNADNRVITGGSGVNLNGEATLTYNGSGTLEIDDSGSSYTLKGASAKHEIGASASDNDLVIQNNKNTVNATSNIIFKGSGSGGESVKERLRIDSNGNARFGPGGTIGNYTNYTTLVLANTAGGDIEFRDSGNNNLVGDLIGAEGAGMYLSSKQDTPIYFRTGASNTVKMDIASDGNVHINTTDNGTASAKLNIENSASAGVDLLKIINKPSSANGKAKMVFYTETSTGQGCSPYIQSLSGADAGPNATNNHNAGGLEFHTRSGGSGTDNNAMRIRDDGTVEKYGSVGQILLNPSGAELEFTRGSASNILCSHSAGYLNIFTGGYSNVPAMRIFASAGAGTGAKVGINTDQSSGDWQMAIHANPSVPSMMISHGIRMLSNTASNKRINNSGVCFTSGSFTANNNWNRIAIGRYMGGSFTLVIGDASSKNTIFGNFHLTAPNYGVGHLNKITTNGAWNTGSSDIQIQNDGQTYDYAIMAKHNSYYNSSATASYGLITNIGL